MKIRVSVPDREVSHIVRTLELYRRATGKDLEATINRFMRNVAIYSMAHTPIASRDGIERELRRVIKSQVYTKKGNLRKKPRAVKVANTVARAIYVRNLRRAGIDPSKTDPGEISRGVEKMIDKRLRGVGYHRAGWIPALRKFGAPLLGGAKAFGPAKGSASKATETRLRAEMSNFAKAIDIVGDKAFRTALRDAQVDMESYAKGLMTKRTAETNSQLR